jgi:hypothetical protein
MIETRRIVKTKCSNQKCKNFIITQVKFNPSDKKFYHEAYCDECIKEEPLRKLVVEEDLISKFLPEIKAIEKGRIKALKGKEIDNFFKKLIGGD